MTQIVEPEKVGGLRGWLTDPKMLGRIAEVAAKHIEPEQMVRAALLCAKDNPRLASCDPISILQSLMAAAQCGLKIGVQSCSEAYLVPFKGQCTMIPSYMGLMELAYRSGRVKIVSSREVREGDEFDYAYGTAPYIHHKPLPDNDGKILYFYAWARLFSDELQFEVMTTAEVDKIRNASPGRDIKGGPWKEHYVPMGRKCPVRRLCKMLPRSTEMDWALLSDDQAAVDMKRAEVRNLQSVGDLTQKLKDSIALKDQQDAAGQSDDS